MHPRRPDARQAAVDVWTRKPSGSGIADAGSATSTGTYLSALLADSIRRAPWLTEALGIPDSGGREVLDVGCGPGLELVRMATLGAEVTGVDLVPVHVEQARINLAELGLRGQAIVADAEALPLPDRRFDRVISNNALQFTSRPARAMKEVHRVLRPGGEARIIVYHRDSVYFWWEMVVRAGLLRFGLLQDRSIAALLSRNLPWNVDGADLPVHVWSRVGLRRLLRRLGYVDVSTAVRGVEPRASSGQRRFRTDGLRDRAERWVRDHTGWYLIARARRPPDG